MVRFADNYSLRLPNRLAVQFATSLRDTFNPITIAWFQPKSPAVLWIIVQMKMMDSSKALTVLFVTKSLCWVADP